MSGRFYLVILVLWTLFSFIGKADNNTPLIITVQDSSLSIKSTIIALSDLKTSTNNYLRVSLKPGNYKTHQKSENSPLVIIRLNNITDTIYLSRILEQIEISFYDYKNQIAIRRYQKYYETLDHIEQTKIDSICNFKIKRSLNNELITIIPQLNHRINH